MLLFAGIVAMVFPDDGSVLEVMYDKDDLEVIKVDMFRTSESNNN